MSRRKKSLLKLSLLAALTGFGMQAYAALPACNGPKWEPGLIAVKGDYAHHTGKQFVAKWWTQAEPDATNTSGAWTYLNDCEAGGVGPIDPTIPTEHKPLPTGPSDELYCSFKVISYTDTTFKGEIKLANTNSGYAWNGTWYNVLDVNFETTSEITSAQSAGGQIAYTHTPGNVAFDPGWQHFFETGKTLTFTVTGNKTGDKPFPSNCSTNYARANDIVYPAYQGLPASWTKGKTNLTAADLIADPVSYYATNVPKVTDSMIMYNPPNPTQIQLGLVQKMNYVVNTTPEVRIFMPTPYLAMGMAFAYQHLKINPNYMCALGTKENYTCGVVPDRLNLGASGEKVILDGEQYTWPIIPAHGDGPFQTEAGNFNDMAKVFPDWYPAGSKHSNFVTASADLTHPNWIRSAVTSALSLTVTREHLHAVPGADFTDFITQAKDKWAEFAMLTFAYNRGSGMFFSTKVLSDNRQQALLSDNIAADFGMSGFASHNETIRAITEQMNDSTNLYDHQLTLADVTAFVDAMRAFYAQGVPSDAEWTTMKGDIERAFGVLAAHWGGQTISFRHDFLTILRVMEKHLPKPEQPRPTGDHWYYISQNVQL